MVFAIRFLYYAEKETRFCNNLRSPKSLVEYSHMNRNQVIGIVVLIIIIIIGGFVLFTRDTHAPETTDDDMVTTAGDDMVTTVGNDIEQSDEQPSSEEEQPANVDTSGTSENTASKPKGFGPDPDLYTTVTYTEFGFTPSTVTVDAGDEVFFWNKSDDFLWIASAVHPVHSEYPGTHINNCGTSAATGTFDSCGNIAVKNGWTFVFNEKGSWVYHDHNDPTRTGTIIVQ